MSVELKTNNKILQVDGNFTYTRQVADIGDVSTSNSDHTNTFQIIKDQNSIEAFKGLSLVGSLSLVPYTKIDSQLVADSIPIVNEGWTQITEATKSHFKISIINGNIDFWKAIEGVTLADIDLSLADHIKNREGVKDSWMNDYYKYIVGQYTNFNYGPADAYNTDVLNPAISEKYIFDQIFAYIGMTYQMTPIIDSWLVVPKENESDTTPATVMYLEIYNEQGDYLDGTYDVDFTLLEIYEGSFDQTTHKITVDSPAYYKHSIDFTRATARYGIRGRDGQDSIEVLPIDIYLEVNGVRVSSDVWIAPADNVYLRIVPIKNEDLVDLGFPDYTIIAYLEATIQDFEFDFTRLVDVYYTFDTALAQVTAKDFVKQIMHRYSFTLFYDKKNVEFMTFDERLDAPTVPIISMKERKSEKYLYRGYAQRNLLVHKYDVEGEDFNNGLIVSDNRNLKLEDVLISSFTYSQSVDGVMRMWEFGKADENGRVTWKLLKDRFFSVRQKTEDGNIKLYSDFENLPVQNYVGPISRVDFEKTGFRYFTETYYQGFQNRILNKTKTHLLELDMSIGKFIQIDLKKKVHIRDEAAEYLINKAVYKGEGKVELEVARVR